ncbi:peptidase [Pseudoalteromonas rubra]|uniref:Peptidase n=1 Tax=Pseudoalteromonas rubra TaxID=43658 RepID=A0A5S3WI13_9GAMM|nr:prolyl oligopeptidase family serine peptidase [Pseudoalteromonas rubra]TMP26136.1 peptidase [Pseudoalteromonas rubra]TMP32939.1 peptidase [Pseudoalteromonas rubra]
MYRFVVVLLLLSFASTSAVGSEVKSELNNVKSCYRGIFSEYSTWESAMQRKFSSNGIETSKAMKKLSGFKSRFTEEDFNYFKSKLSCQTFTYRVDGIDVQGFVIKPIVLSEKAPVIIYNRGGNGNYGAVVFGSMMANLFPLAKEGFVIVGSQYRGTFTKEDNLDEFGGQDVNDIVALMDIIPHIEGVDIKRVGMYGVSRGAMQTYLAAKKIPSIKAIAAVAGVVDLKKELEYRPNMEKVYKNRIPLYESDKDAQLLSRSAISWVEKLSKETPILLLHGDQDKRVSVDNSRRFSEALNAGKIPNKLIIYKNDNHFLEKNRRAVFAELSGWFHSHL